MVGDGTVTLNGEDGDCAESDVITDEVSQDNIFDRFAVVNYWYNNAQCYRNNYAQRNWPVQGIELSENGEKIDNAWGIRVYAAEAGCELIPDTWCADKGRLFYKFPTIEEYNMYQILHSKSRGF